MMPNNYSRRRFLPSTRRGVFLAVITAMSPSAATPAQRPNEFTLPREDLHNDRPEIGFRGGVIAVPSDEVPAISAVGGPFPINATFAANITAAQQAVIQQAVNEWQTIIETAGINPNSLPITFQNGPLAGSTIGLTIVTYSTGNGAIVSAVMMFDNDGSTTWFVDPTPGNDSEFDATPPAGCGRKKTPRSNNSVKRGTLRSRSCKCAWRPWKTQSHQRVRQVLRARWPQARQQSPQCA